MSYLPSLKPDDVVIMDNMRSHHAKVVCELLNRKSIHYRYLPPYSPDLNPIEKLWSKFEAILRKIKARLLAQLPDAIRSAIDSICPHDCSAWFHTCLLR